MSKGLIFFCCAACILVLTVINLSIAPIINRKVANWGTENCARYKDEYDKEKDGGKSDDDLKYAEKWNLDRCKNWKAMSNMEYTSLIFDIAIGFVCGLIGLLHLFDLKKDFVSNTGLIGLGCGVVGFVLTFVYVILNGIVYTNYYDNPSLYKTDGDGAFAELDGNNYKCFYFDKKGNSHALIAKFSDYGKKQYNYNKDLIESFSSDEVSDCTSSLITACSVDEHIPETKTHGGSKCKYLYYPQTINTITNKDKSDRFLTVLILSLFVCLANIGLALFGFLLFRTPGDF